MNPPTLILGASLAANLALGAVWLWRQPAPVASPSASAPRPTAAAKPATPAAPAITPETWRDLAAASDADFVARLRAEGFPARAVATLVYARLAEKHAHELKKFEASGDYAYWRRSTSFAFQAELSPELRAARRALDRQIGDEARQLLGEDAEQMDSYMRAERKRTYGDLPREKAEQLASINRDYNELSTMVRDRMKGAPLPEDREQLAALEAEQRADLAAVLTPAELQEYDLRASPSARTTQSRLRFFDPTEEEYRAIATLQLAFDQNHGGNHPSGAQQQQRNAAQAELAEQIKALLPPDRFAEYEIKTDSTYSSMSYLLAQYNPSADASAAVRTQKDLATRYNAIRNDRTLSPDVRNARLDALAAEARAKMDTVLGAKAYEAFRANGGPINSLVNRKSGAGKP